MAYPLGIVFKSRAEIEAAYAPHTPAEIHATFNGTPKTFNRANSTEMDKNMSTKNNVAKSTKSTSTKSTAKYFVNGHPATKKQADKVDAKNKIEEARIAKKSTKSTAKKSAKKAAPKQAAAETVETSLGNVHEKVIVLKSTKGIDDLPKQAQCILNTLKKSGGNVLFSEFLPKLAKCLDTVQSPKRIYMFYQRSLIDAGYITTQASK